MATIYLDMDGTIADLYGVKNWLDYLIAENTLPYRRAKLMLTEKQIKWLQDWVANGNDIGIISWLSKCGSRKYNKQVRACKVYWLKKNLPLPYAKIHIVKYGTPKHKFNAKGNILIDDEIRNLIEWHKAGGKALSPEDFAELVDKWEE